MLVEDFMLREAPSDVGALVPPGRWVHGPWVSGTGLYTDRCLSSEAFPCMSSCFTRFQTNGVLRCELDLTRLRMFHDT